MASRGSRREAWAEFLRCAHGLSTPAPQPKLPQIAAPPPRARKRATAATLLANLFSATSEDAGIPDTQVVDILVLGKPRMTQRDRWQKRPAVLRYRAFCDELRLRKVRVPNRYGAICILPMPKSWSERTKEAMNGMPHLQKPDNDNIEGYPANSVEGHYLHACSSHRRLAPTVGQGKAAPRRQLSLSPQRGWPFQ